MIFGYVRETQSTPNADGLNPVEVHIDRQWADGLPFVENQRVEITLAVGGQTFTAGLRATTKNRYVWISPNVLDSSGQNISLAALLRDADISKNQRVTLTVDGTKVTLKSIVIRLSARNVTSRQAVLDAIAEYEKIGEQPFLKKYRFRRAKEYLLIHNRKEYPSKAIVGAAHGYQFPEIGPMGWDEFEGGAATVETALKRLSFDVIRKPLLVPSASFTLPDEIDPDVPLIEGKPTTIIVNAYERSPKARAKCIKHYGAKCWICGFDFGAIYGDDFDGYIHVHHLRPVSERGGEYVVDPIIDLRPVCPNCHAILHLGKVTRELEDVKVFIEQQRAKVESK